MCCMEFERDDSKTWVQAHPFPLLLYTRLLITSEYYNHVHSLILSVFYREIYFMGGPQTPRSPFMARQILTKLDTKDTYAISTRDGDEGLTFVLKKLYQWFSSVSEVQFAISWWRHQNIFLVTHLLWGESTGRRWFPLIKACDAELWFFSLIYAWAIGGAHNLDTGDLRRHRSHYDVSVIIWNRLIMRLGGG